MQQQQMCVGIIFVGNISSPHRGGVTTDIKAPQYDEYYISSDLRYTYSENVNPTLPCTAWNIGCDLL